MILWEGECISLKVRLFSVLKNFSFLHVISSS